MQTDEDILQKHRNLILQASGDGVYGIDADGLTTFSNPAAERLTGYSSEELVGKGSHALIHHSHADGSHFPNTECPIYAAFKDGKVHRVTDEVFWRKDGSNFPVEYISSPIIDNGEITGAVVSFRDITDRKQAEMALSESEERYRKIVESTHEAIILARVSDGVMLDVNDEACRMLGITRDALMTKTAEDLHPHQMGVHREFMASLLATGKVKTDKLSWLASNGTPIPLRVSASVVQLQEARCILFIAQDMREYLKAEQRARKLQADLHHGARVSSMGELASGLAHELNQPLAAMMNYLQACKMLIDAADTGAPGKVLEYLSKAAAQAERAGKIISGLRSFVQKGECNRTAGDLNEIAKEAIGLLAPNATAEGIDFRTIFSSDLPRISVDRIQIQQVVFNLVRNAIEALSTVADAQLTVTTSASNDNSVQICISDNGPGVSDDMLTKLFVAFTTTKSGGMGVGLSICKSIVEDHGGQIRADRNPGGGLRFAVTLPAEVGGSPDV
ncbi:MAG: PAS domain S-box protein [Marinosulfonomonas sp.]|nr:PAS domain S-box protein [Marinosulfonomonas sp.]